MTTIEEVSTKCFICSIDLPGELVEGSQVVEILMNQSEVGEISVADAVVCDHCHTRYCNTHKKELDHKLLTGFIKSTCLKCRQPIGDSFSILQGDVAKVQTEMVAKVDIEKKKREAEPEGFYFPAKKIPEECPGCGGTNISAILRPEKSTVSRIIDIVGGLLIAGATYYFLVISDQFANMDESLLFILQILGLYLGITYIWLGLTLRPAPFLGRYIIAPDFETHATCKDCQHTWIAEMK